MADTPPDPWSVPDDGPGTQPPPGWGTPTPQGQQQWPPQQGQKWGDFTPPPGWRPAPTKSVRMRGVFAGLGAWLAVNALLWTLGEPLIVLLANLAVVIFAAVKGYKSFAVGFALGYVVAFVLLLGACFLFLAGGMGGVF